MWRFVREENVEGMEPVKRLLGNEMTRSLVSWASWGGMDPVTIPGERMSWVNSVSWEMDRGSEPASGSVSVPSERMVTRLILEQVTPENEEQGFGAVKFQVEKKELEDESSVRVFFMERRALRSNGFIFGFCSS